MNPITFTSTESPTVIYACGNCRFTWLEEDLAQACCRCPVCGGENKGPGTSWCDGCRKADYHHGVARREEAERSLPVVEDKGEPVLVGSGFYETIHDAALALWDDGEDPAEAVAFPCTVRKAFTPDIAEFVEEAWGSNYDEPERYDIVLPKDLAVELQKRVEAHAPTVWTARVKERVLLPAIETSVAK